MRARLSHSTLLALFVAACASNAPDPKRRPNIVFILADDHAAHAIGAYGSTVAHTPNIDRIAREGMRFANAFCGNAICAPARASIMTGVHSHVHGVIDNARSFDATQPTFATSLQKGGYQTALVGKWHLKSDPAGFDYWDVFPDQGQYYDPVLKSASGTREVPGYASEVVTDLALEWLDARDSAAPFLLCLNHKAPHRSWEPGPNEIGLYADETLPEPADLFDDYATRAGGAAAQEMTVARHLSEFDLKLGKPTPKTKADIATWRAAYDAENAALGEHPLEGDARTHWNYQRYMKDYLRCVAGVDASVGRVLAWLDEHGLAQDTIVVYASDQGFFLGDHGWYDKRWMYEEALRFPLVVRWPERVAAGSVDEHLVQNIDLAPTLCEVAAAAPLANAQGTSLLGLLEHGASQPWRAALYYRYYEYPQPHRVEPHFGVRTERYKLIRFPRLDAWELYDLRSDPAELHNRIDDPASAEVVGELKRELERLRAELGDGAD